MRYRSIAVWPDTIKVGNVAGKNESDDTHDTEEQALAVCRMLKRDGYGGDRKVFPLSTRVEPIEDDPEPIDPNQHTTPCRDCRGLGRTAGDGFSEDTVDCGSCGGLGYVPGEPSY